jgi:hypothetical protein
MRIKYLSPVILAILAGWTGCDSYSDSRNSSPAVPPPVDKPREGVHVNVPIEPNGPAGPRDGVHVNTTPDGGVDVKVEGEPIRDLLRSQRVPPAVNAPIPPSSNP